MNTKLASHHENEETGLYRTYEAFISAVAPSLTNGFTAEEMTTLVRRDRKNFTIAISTVQPRIRALCLAGKIAKNGETRKSSKGKEMDVYIWHEHEPDIFTELGSKVVILHEKGNAEHCVVEVDGKRSHVMNSRRAAFDFIAALFTVEALA